MTKWDVFEREWDLALIGVEKWNFWSSELFWQLQAQWKSAGNTTPSSNPAQEDVAKADIVKEEQGSGTTAQTAAIMEIVL